MPITIVRSARRRPLVVLAAVTGLLALAACGGGAPTVPEPRTVGPDIKVDKSAPPKPAVPTTWPLTGVAASKPANRPALSVKIENPREVRPQTGLDQADMVWEQVVEGGVTRYVAVFHSQVPAVVGPIRSVRPMDPAITAPMHGLLAFSGGQPGFVAAVKAANVQAISNDAGNPGFYRTHPRPAPHNVFGTPSTFWGQADASHKNSPPAQFPFARIADKATAVVSGKPTSSVQIKMSGYSQPSWTWDGPSGMWQRSEAGVPATAASGARLAARNVITLRVQLVDSGTRDPAGNVVPETKLVSKGEALVATGGRSIAATWSKVSLGSPVVLTAADGSIVKLAAGKTWIELVPIGSGSVTRTVSAG